MKFISYFKNLFPEKERKPYQYSDEDLDYANKLFAKCRVNTFTKKQLEEDILFTVRHLVNSKNTVIGISNDGRAFKHEYANPSHTCFCVSTKIVCFLNKLLDEIDRRN